MTEPAGRPPRRSLPARAVAWVAVRLWFLIVPAFVAAAVYSGLHMRTFETGSGVLNLVPKDAPALRAEETATRLFRAPAGSDVIVVQHAPGGLSEDAQHRVIDRAAAIDRHRDTSTGASLATPLISVPGAPASKGNSTTAITHLAFDSSYTPAERTIQGHAFLHRLNQPGDAPVGLTGVTPARMEQGALILDRLDLIEVLTVAVVAAIVILVFRSPGAAVITMGSMGVAFPITLYALTELSDRVGGTLPQEIEPLLIALLLGVVTDYSVFFLSDFRDRFRAGSPPRDCAFAAAAEVAPIVFTGGLILSVSLIALRASSLGFFRDLGPALAATVAIAMLVSVLFVPAAIAMLGRFAVWPSARPDPQQRRNRLGARVAHIAAGRPVAALIGVLTAAVLTVAALELRTMHLGVDVITGLPASSESQVAARAAAKGFAPGVLAPAEVIVQSRSGALPAEGLASLERSLRSQQGIAGVAGPAEQPPGAPVQPFLTPDRRAARYVLVSDRDPLGPGAVSDLEHLEDAMPGLIRQAGMGGAEVQVAGQTALAKAAIDAVTRDAITIAVAVLLVNLLLMIVFMRALVAPVALLVVNALSVTATMGAAVWVFQHQLGYPDLTYYVPFAGAVLLVSLSSDYNVLIAGRIWREAERRPMREAIAIAIPQASRAIRAAGLSLAASFALVALIPIRPFRELAGVMALGILLETFLVRSLLAPAVIAVLGRFAGWPGRPGWSSGNVAPPQPDPTPR
ncbi:MAG TPA: MMPL family transporter [Gaiellales bacterium]